MAEAVARTLPDLSRYPDDAQRDALIAQIAALEGVAPEQVVPGEVLEPLGLFLASRRKGGGAIVYSNPGYTALVDSAAPLGGKGVAVPLDAQLRNDLPALARAVDAHTLAVSLINPHNPSGTVSDAAELDAFVKAVGKRALVVVDEAYLEYDGDFAARSAVRLLRAGENVLVFRTLAKVYGLAGLSIGYALAPPALATDLRAWGIGATHSFSRPQLAAAAAALADQDYVASVRARNERERARVTRELEQLGLRHTKSRANFVFFHAPGAAERIRAAFSSGGIQVARAFPPLNDWVRVTLGKPAENDAVLGVLRAAVRKT